MEIWDSAKMQGLKFLGAGVEDRLKNPYQFLQGRNMGIIRLIIKYFRIKILTRLNQLYFETLVMIGTANQIGAQIQCSGMECKQD